jgi:hypothetical protein
MPKGFLTEDGPQRHFADLYDAREMPTPSYLARTIRNVEDNEGTIWVGRIDTLGAKTTLDACKHFWKPLMLVTPSDVVLAFDVVAWLRRNREIKCLNIAGNREPKNPGIGARFERSLIAVFKRINEALPRPSLPAEPNRWPLDEEP